MRSPGGSSPGLHSRRLRLRENLSQPIDPGWSFGNVIVNKENSNSPSTEHAIVSKESYGRQIGKLLNAMYAMLEAQGGDQGVAAYREVIELWNTVEEIKVKAAKRRIDILQRDLEVLKTSDAETFNREMTLLRAFS